MLTAPPVVDDISRRGLLTGLGATGLLTACGAGPGATPEGPADAAPGYPRQVTHTGGVTEIPAPPQRVACLTPLGELEALLTLGIAPVQIGVRSFTGEFLGDPLALWPWQQAVLDAIGADPDRVSADTLPASAEVVAGARPDLIIGRAAWVDDARAQLEAVAPVLISDVGWRDNLRIVGAAFAREDDAERIIAETDARITSVLDGIALDGPTYALVRSDDAGTFSLPVDPTYAPVDLFSRAGFRLLPELDALALAGETFPEFSLEEVGRMDAADVLVVLDFTTESTDAFLDNPLVQRIPAIAEGRFVRIQGGPEVTAAAGFSALNADLVLPNVRRAGELLTGR